MDAVWNRPGTPHVEPDPALPVRLLPLRSNVVVVKLRPDFSEPPESVQRFMQLPLGIGRDVRYLPAEHGNDFLRIQPQAGRLCLAQHPSQGDFRQAALSFGVTAADIRVNAREPDLFYILIRSCRVMDQVLTEKCTSLINRYCVSNHRNIRQRRGIAKMPDLSVDGIENP